MVSFAAEVSNLTGQLLNFTDSWVVHGFLERPPVDIPDSQTIKFTGSDNGKGRGGVLTWQLGESDTVCVLYYYYMAGEPSFLGIGSIKMNTVSVTEQAKWIWENIKNDPNSSNITGISVEKFWEKNNYVKHTGDKVTSSAITGSGPAPTIIATFAHTR